MLRSQRLLLLAQGLRASYTSGNRRVPYPRPGSLPAGYQRLPVIKLQITCYFFLSIMNIVNAIMKMVIRGVGAGISRPVAGGTAKLIAYRQLSLLPT